MAKQRQCKKCNDNSGQAKIVGLVSSGNGVKAADFYDALKGHTGVVVWDGVIIETKKLLLWVRTIMQNGNGRLSRKHHNYDIAWKVQASGVMEVEKRGAGRFDEKQIGQHLVLTAEHRHETNGIKLTTRFLCLDNLQEWSQVHYLDLGADGNAALLPQPRNKRPYTLTLTKCHGTNGSSQFTKHIHSCRTVKSAINIIVAISKSREQVPMATGLLAYR